MFSAGHYNWTQHQLVLCRTKGDFSKKADQISRWESTNNRGINDLKQQALICISCPVCLNCGRAATDSGPLPGIAEDPTIAQGWAAPYNGGGTQLARNTAGIQQLDAKVPVVVLFSCDVTYGSCAGGETLIDAAAGRSQATPWQYCGNNSNSTGPLCSVCRPGYRRKSSGCQGAKESVDDRFEHGSSSAKGCQPCPAPTNPWLLVVLALMLILGTTAAIRISRKARSPYYGPIIRTVRIVATSFQGFYSILRILLSNIQIVSNLQSQLCGNLPTAFSRLLRSLKSVFLLDIHGMISLDCWGWCGEIAQKQRCFYTSWLGTVLCIPAAAILLIVSFSAHAYFRDRHDVSARLEAVGLARDRLFLLCFFMYPVISNRIFMLFECKALTSSDPVESWLIDNMAISCTDSNYNNLHRFSVLLLVVFLIGVPVACWWKLQKSVWKLNATDRTDEEKKGIIDAQFGFLTADYTLACCQFEVMEFGAFGPSC